MLEQMHGAVIAASRPQLSCEEWDGMERDGKTVGGRLARVITRWRPPFDSSLRRDSAMDDTGATPRDGQDGILLVDRPLQILLRRLRMAKLEGSRWRGADRTYKSWKAPLDPTVVISSERMRRDCSRDRKAQTRGEKQSHK